MNEEQVKDFANIEAQRIIDQINSLRKEKGLSQEKLAEKSDMSRNTILQVERKKRNYR
ncbi:helix-turn-helix domain-containing protein [Listeria seeligeri]|uniref:helix-turn-helix domain-containing protein n=1 Tax=Listeria seeligeri TaxID=1640 RepID=UPI0022EA91E2|nr:helix-turn-helix transcriptional regulator [Listeria seeligeri]